MRKLTEAECRRKIFEVNKDVEIIGFFTKICKNKPVTYCNCVCKIDGHEWDSRYGNLTQGKKCPVCKGKTLHHTNKLSTVRPDLIKYLKNKEDAENNFSSSKKIVQ